MLIVATAIHLMTVVGGILGQGPVEAVWWELGFGSFTAMSWLWLRDRSDTGRKALMILLALVGVRWCHSWATATDDVVMITVMSLMLYLPILIACGAILRVGLYAGGVYAACLGLFAAWMSQRPELAGTVAGDWRIGPAFGGTMALMTYYVSLWAQQQARLIDLLATLEMRVGERTSELGAALERAEAAEKRQARLLHVMAHELRTPITVILGYIPLLKTQSPNPSPRVLTDATDAIEHSGTVMMDLINDQLTIARLTDAEVKPQQEDVQVDDLLEEIGRSLQILASGKPVEIATRNNSPSAVLTTDRRLLTRLLTNLGSNAVKYTEAGVVTLGFEINGQHAQFRVEDTGRGMSPAQLAQAFEPFTTFHDGTEKRSSGLGLSIVKRIAKVLGGDVEANTRLGEGSCFLFTLPKS